MPIPREKLRLGPDEREELLTSERVAHVATVGADGFPHVVPLWFVWFGDRVWVNSLRRSRRGRDLASGSPVSVCIDAGVEYGELRGITFEGRFEEASSRDPMDEVRSRFGGKYWHGAAVPDMRSHVWLKLVIEKEASWDFRRIQEAGQDRRLQALRDQQDR